MKQINCAANLAKKCLMIRLGLVTLLMTAVSACSMISPPREVTMQVRYVPVVGQLRLMDPPAAPMKKTIPKKKTVTRQQINRLLDACDDYEDVGKPGGYATDEDVFKIHYVEKSSCQFAYFALTKDQELEDQDNLAAVNKYIYSLEAHIAYLREKYFDLYDVLKKVEDKPVP